MPNSPNTTGFVPVKGGSLYYETAGEGPALIFLHAGVANCAMWDDQFAAFSEAYRVVRYDYRNYGHSVTTITEGFSFRDDLLALLDYLNIDRAVLIGLSMGGGLAIDFTLEHPERVRAIVPIAGGLSGYEEPMTETETALFTRYELAEKQKDIDTLADLAVVAWVDGPDQPEGRAPADVREKIYSWVKADGQNHPEEIHPTRLNPPAANRLSEIQVPTLVVIGDLDVSGVIAAMEKVASEVPGARSAHFATAHMVTMEFPNEFNTLLQDFLQEINA
jgi:3-oxoadipate enol-lactonase